MNYTIGIIEDDLKIATLLKEYLEHYGYKTWVCKEFNEIHKQVDQNKPDLLLLDINLPTFDGFFWCKKIRQQSHLPIIFLSARQLDVDQVYALSCGGDDYLTKPFSYEVVTAKIGAHLRRIYGEYAERDSHALVVEGVILEVDTLILNYQSRSLSLTKNEKEVLAALFEHYPQPVKRRELLNRLWDTDLFVE